MKYLFNWVTPNSKECQKVLMFSALIKLFSESSYAIKFIHDHHIPIGCNTFYGHPEHPYIHPQIQNNKYTLQRKTTVM